MKRIINGVTYNTDTAMVGARSTWKEEAGMGIPESEHEHTLYQTRGGAFFVVERKKFGKKKGGEWVPVEEVEFVPMTRENAQEWTLTGTVEMIDTKLFDEPPEAEADVETSATIYLRVPAPLKAMIEAKAASDGQSVNTWLMRCAEMGLKLDKVGEYLGEILQTAQSDLAGCVDFDGNKMIPHMGDMAEEAAKLLGWTGYDLENLSASACSNAATIAPGFRIRWPFPVELEEGTE